MSLGNKFCKEYITISRTSKISFEMEVKLITSCQSQTVGDLLRKGVQQSLHLEQTTISYKVLYGNVVIVTECTPAPQ